MLTVSLNRKENMNHVLGEQGGKEYFKKLRIITPPSSPRFMCPYALWNHMITELCYYVFLGKKKQKLEEERNFEGRIL